MCCDLKALRTLPWATPPPKEEPQEEQTQRRCCKKTFEAERIISLEVRRHYRCTLGDIVFFEWIFETLDEAKEKANSSDRRYGVLTSGKTYLWAREWARWQGKWPTSFRQTQSQAWNKSWVCIVSCRIIDWSSGLHRRFKFCEHNPRTSLPFWCHTSTWSGLVHCRPSVRWCFERIM